MDPLTDFGETHLYGWLNEFSISLNPTLLSGSLEQEAGQIKNTQKTRIFCYF
jgi:hypothetical protein